MGAGVVSKDFVVRMIHCYARPSWKIKQNFAAAKVTKYTQTQGSRVCENRSLKVQLLTKNILVVIKGDCIVRCNRHRIKIQDKQNIMFRTEKITKVALFPPERSSLSKAF